MTLSRTWWALSLCVACGGSSPPASPSPSPPPSASSAAPDAGPAAADAKPAAPDARPDPRPAAADAKPTTSADVTPPPPRDERLEDKKTEKATGVAGSYRTGVLSAAGLDPAELGKALGAVAPKLDGCYSAYLSKRPSAGLHTSYDVVVDPGGKTQSAKLRADETRSAELHKCLEGVLRTVSWPKPTEKVGKTTIEWTLGT